MKYYFSFKVQYQEVDTSLHLRLYTLENFLLNVAGRVADYLGYGLIHFLPRKLSWIITRLNLSMFELPKLSDIVVIETWIESNVHTVSIRNFRIYKLINPKYNIDDIDRRDHGCPVIFSKQNFKLIGEAKSYWTILNLETRTMVNVFDEDIFFNAVDGDIITVPRVSKALIHNTEESQNGSREYRVKYTDIDYNMHCNSCKYIEMLFDTYLFPNFQSRPFCMEINYRKELSEGTIVNISYEKFFNAVFYKIVDESGELCCNSAFSFQ